MLSVFRDITAHHPNDHLFYKLSVKMFPEISQEFGVRGVRCSIVLLLPSIASCSQYLSTPYLQTPTFIAFQGGYEIGRAIGANRHVLFVSIVYAISYYPLHIFTQDLLDLDDI